jgi:hypothetical protein
LRCTVELSGLRAEWEAYGDLLLTLHILRK